MTGKQKRLEHEASLALLTTAGMFKKNVEKDTKQELCSLRFTVQKENCVLQVSMQP